MPISSVRARDWARCCSEDARVLKRGEDVSKTLDARLEEVEGEVVDAAAVRAAERFLESLPATSASRISGMQDVRNGSAGWEWKKDNFYSLPPEITHPLPLFGT
jgi:hypothetical protein